MIIADALTPLQYVNFKRTCTERAIDSMNSLKHDLQFIDRKAGGILRISTAFGCVLAIHYSDVFNGFFNAPVGKRYAYSSFALTYWTGITYGMNLLKDLISNDLHPKNWSIAQVNTADAAQATVYSLFSILVLQHTDYHVASQFAALPRFLLLAGTNACWLVSTSLLRGKDRATTSFNAFRSILGGIIATPLSIPLTFMGMTDTVLQSKTASELVGGLGEGTIRYLRGIRSRKTKDLEPLVRTIINEDTTEDALMKGLLDIIRIWSKVPFGKGALRRTLLSPRVSYRQTQKFLFAFGKQDRMRAFIQCNTDGFRKPQHIRKLYEQDILRFNKWTLKILLRKNEQERRASLLEQEEKERYEHIAQELLERTDTDRQCTIEQLARENIRHATLIILCIAKQAPDQYKKVLTDWDPRMMALRNDIIRLIKEN